MELQIKSINDRILKAIALENDDGDKVINGNEIEIFNSQAQKALDAGLVTEEAFKETMGLYGQKKNSVQKKNTSSVKLKDLFAQYKTLPLTQKIVLAIGSIAASAFLLYGCYCTKKCVTKSKEVLDSVFDTLGL